MPSSTSRHASRRTRLIAGCAIVIVAAGLALFALTRSADHSVRNISGPTLGPPTVGSDLHSVAVVGSRTFVTGHEGAALRDGQGPWVPITSLSNTDVMAVASLPKRLLAGGHGGLFDSTDGGLTFARQPSGSVTDVHALGAAGSTIYLASPQAGLLISTDEGKTFTLRSSNGRTFMGNLLVDPANTANVIASDMKAGIVATSDGGQTWRSLGGPVDVMSIAWSLGDNREIVAVGMDSAAISTDGGASWSPLSVPAKTSAITINSGGDLIAGALSGTQALVYSSSDGGKTWAGS